VDNALKFTETGSVVVALTSTRTSVTDTAVTVAVSDTGIGMSSQTMAKLFQPFSQGDASSKKRYPGTGLGLSICKQLVELMGGSLSVESHEGSGSTFSFHMSLPVAQPRDRKDDAENSFKIKTGRVSEKPLRPEAHILVAEDNPVNQNVIVRLLRRIGYANFEVVPDGQEAVNKVKGKHFDIVLMDVQMPRMDGLEATKTIRNEIGSDIKIVAMTANALKGDDDKCLQAGMDDYIAKPVSIALLSQKLNQHLRL
jgi:CheY-like chemotaxis protein